MSKKASSAKKISKKQARQSVYDQLAAALAGFRRGIKEKKFERNLRRASRLFAGDIAKAANKTKGKVPKKVKEPTQIKTDPKSELQAAS